MARAKTKIFRMSVKSAGIDVISRMELTEVEFNRQLSYLNNSVAEAANDDEIKISSTSHTARGEFTATTQYMFNFGGATTVLEKVECHPGFAFHPDKK